MIKFELKRKINVFYNITVFFVLVSIIISSTIFGFSAFNLEIGGFALRAKEQLINLPSIIAIVFSIVILLITLLLLYFIQRNSEDSTHELETHIEFEIQGEAIRTMLKILEKHDPYTKGHSESVAKFSSEFATFIGISERKINDIHMAGLVHDIGKILIPTSILNKPDRLSGSEFDLIKMHPVYAYEILNENKTMKDVAVFVKYHHEWYDGKGYPENLCGENIPFESRLLAIVDSWDAMTSDRIYKKGISEEEALIVLQEHSGTQFDPILVKKWEVFFNKKRIS